MHLLFHPNALAYAGSQQEQPRFYPAVDIFLTGKMSYTQRAIHNPSEEYTCAGLAITVP